MTVVYLRDVGTEEDECWVVCAKGDPGAVAFEDVHGVAQTSGWQPIETALKDGTPILVDFGKHGIHRVIWDSPFDWGEGTKIWCVDDQKHSPYPLRGYSESDEAGWMPLPPPSNQGASK